MELPQLTYEWVQDSLFPFAFQRNQLLQIQYKNQAGVIHPILHYPQLKADLFLTYRSIKEPDQLALWQEQARKMVYDHAQKASRIEEIPIDYPQKQGVFYVLKGEVATNFQFYFTDQRRHFVRGAFYFQAVPNQDSLAPFAAYAEADLWQIISSWTWKK